VRALLSLCRLLVMLHPSRIRRLYGDEMLEVVRASVEESRAHGSRRAATAAAVRSVWGLVASLVGFWREERPASGVVDDGRNALRGLVRTPGFTALAVGMLALAVGAVTAIFAAVHDTLLRPPSFEDPDRVVLVWGSNPQNGQLRDVVAGPNYLDQRRENVTLEALAAFRESEMILVEDGRPGIVNGLAATVDLGSVLKTEPYLGRWFEPEEGFSSGEAAVMLGYDFWQRRFGGYEGVLGSRIDTQDGPRTVVGILPPDLRLPWSTNVILPLYEDVLAAQSRTHYHYWLLGRLRRGVTIEEADRDLDAVMDRIGAQDPRLADWEARVEGLQATVTEPVRPALLALLVGVGLVLLITAANLANLLLVRGTARRPELAVRAALGASRWRVRRQLLMEGLAIGAAAAIGGLIVSVFLVRALAILAPATVSISGSAATVDTLHVSLSPLAALLGCGLALVTGVLLALPTAFRAGPIDGGRVIRGSGLRVTDDRRDRRGRSVLVIAELALATALLAVAGLSVRTTAGLLAVDPGMRADHVLTLYFGDLQDADSPERASFFRQALAEASAVPGVVGAGLADYVPFEGEDDFGGLYIEGRPRPAPGRGLREEWRRVSAGFFETAGVRVVKGRGFTDLDDADESRSVAVVNEAFVRRHFPGEDPVGQRITIHNRAYDLTEIVGVVADVRGRGLDQPAPPVFYTPFHRGPRPTMALFVRTEGEPAAWIDPVREAIWRVDGGTPIAEERPLQQILSLSMGVRRLTLILVGGLALTALVLASVGVFGVIAYSVRMRKRELGVRLALGASPGSIQRLVLGQGLVLCAVGLTIGTAGALAAGRASARLWYGVGSFDPASLGAALAILVAAGAVASYLPARQAARTAPVESLAGD